MCLNYSRREFVITYLTSGIYLFTRRGGHVYVFLDEKKNEKIEVYILGAKREFLFNICSLIQMHRLSPRSRGYIEACGRERKGRRVARESFFHERVKWSGGNKQQKKLMQVTESKLAICRFLRLDRLT